MKANRFKIVMIGDSGVGKTALVHRMSQDTFLPNHVPTVGSQFLTIESVVEGNPMLFEIWDTAGQELYRSLVGFYARDARGALLVVDLTSMPSFISLSSWVRFIRSEAPDVKIVIFANKADLEGQICVRIEQIIAFANDNQCTTVEGSAKTGLNVAEAFAKMGEMMLATVEEKESEQRNAGISLKEGKRSETTCC